MPDAQGINLISLNTNFQFICPEIETFVDRFTTPRDFVGLVLGGALENVSDLSGF